VVGFFWCFALCFLAFFGVSLLPVIFASVGVLLAPAARWADFAVSFAIDAAGAAGLEGTAAGGALILAAGAAAGLAVAGALILAAAGVAGLATGSFLGGVCAPRKDAPNTVAAKARDNRRACMVISN
jgi:hypothetical protein